MSTVLPLAAALLLGAAGTAPDAPPLGGPATAGLRLLASEPEAPPPEAPGGSIAEVGVAHAAGQGKHRSWFAFPAVFWLPETRLGFAGSGGVHFRLHGAEQASNAFLVVGYTTKGQGSVDLSSDVHLDGGTLLSGRARAVDYGDAFYGIGPGTTLAQREELTRRFVNVALSADLPVLGRRLRAGPRLDARVEEVADAAPGGLVASGGVEGADGFSAIGLGAGLTWDSRDRPLWPSHGGFAQASYLYYPAELGRNDGFGKASLEGRLFLPLGRERVLGLAAFAEESHGETPFTVLPKLGSTRYLRGVREGRFRDQLAWAAQAELRVPVAPRLFATAFGAFGGVGPDLAALRADDLQIAGGAGLRVRLTEEGANLRCDVAVGDAGPEVYLLLLEAF
jgi:hypothetical protein